MTNPEPDRLRELLDAVLDERHQSLDAMAGAAHTTRFHFARTVSARAGESPVAMRRRVMLERAAWQLRAGTPVIEAAVAAGYESAEGFSRAFARAFGHPPSVAAAAHWLPSPNGVHFHPPTSLWVHEQEVQVNPLVEQLIRHDVDDTAELIAFAATLDPAELVRVTRPGQIVLDGAGEEGSIADVLANLVYARLVWLAAFEGTVIPEEPERDLAVLAPLNAAVSARWLACVRDIERRGAWGDRFVDALCEPPESFVVSSVVAHVLTYSAHRRELARGMLVAHGLARNSGDPILWLRQQRGEG
ncbi:helix-turn-helix protein [Leucobacter luti]|uniref:Helix-turn-helix protein n=1 Tax=Leucobacter luti TaxID=340320 RepID=A0A4R6RU77_9MICO|nr:helix-turn-helix domain-containing protein [Leucobacter luti]MCW2288064.1 AraC-like DNA-binding protein [Leucobacter luti]TCK45774.1 helix-turn-helix protein [Leucobacter luti]TDP90334.1 helix-turn-helix protein [Leucobacter luti]